MGQTVKTWSPEMIRAWENTRPIVLNRLSRAQRTREVEDVMNEVWIAAAEGLDSFDEQRGSFQGWINGIAVRQSLRMVRSEARRGNTTEAIAQAASSGVSTVYDVVAEDFGDAVAGEVSDWAHVSEVLRMVRAAVSQRRLFDRSMRLILECDGDVGEAARRFGIAAPALRDSHRNVLDLARVIQRALSSYWRRREERVDRAVSFRDLLNCLPAESEESRAWIGTIARAVASRGGFGNVSAADVAQMTGMAEVTARHCLARTSWLLMIARTVLENGDLE
ncbi:RNA polymerase sigma factor [Kocuria sp. HSID16901]|uniref:RNA polymerase sigma factor n=1 Tax=Kocuria sp. HSID16901 TaxID=2419505 RepID=UPI00065FD798|nr:sigma factor [Kocuria sp. HSID16901]RUQ20908.1 hypothetical protein D8M21_08385 [Kocuria sp. HSID16901]